MLTSLKSLFGMKQAAEGPTARPKTGDKVVLGKDRVAPPPEVVRTLLTDETVWVYTDYSRRRYLVVSGKGGVEGPELHKAQLAKLQSHGLCREIYTQIRSAEYWKQLSRPAALQMVTRLGIGTGHSDAVVVSHELVNSPVPTGHWIAIQVLHKPLAELTKERMASEKKA